VLVRARPDVTYCGDPGTRHKPSWTVGPCVIQDTETDDEIWIPAVTKAGLAIITRDKLIEARTHEKDQVLKAGARMFAIASEGNLDIWGLLEVVVTRWREMEQAAEEPGPYIYQVTRTGRLTKVQL
jgi:hypothetical protein